MVSNTRVSSFDLQRKALNIQRVAQRKKVRQQAAYPSPELTALRETQVQLREAREENAHLRLMTQDRYSPEVQQAFQDRYDEMRQQLREALEQMEGPTGLRSSYRAACEVASEWKKKYHDISELLRAAEARVRELEAFIHEKDVAFGTTSVGRAPLLALLKKWQAEYSTPYANRCGDPGLATDIAELEAALRR